MNDKCNNAPIAVFIYNRPDHTQRTLESLQRCSGFSQSPLFIFCDGPKLESDNTVQEARNIAYELVGDNAVIIESNFNQGLASSIITGVSKLCREYGKVIVIEDDLLVATSFLKFMNDALELYENDEIVMQVSGHMYSEPKLATKQEAFFLPFTASWGWATWQRAWGTFDLEAMGWEVLKTNKKARFHFNLGNSYDYYSMLEKQMTGKLDSWAIRWYWTVFQNNGLVLYPPSPLVTNIGFDGTGTHGWRSARSINIFHDRRNIPQASLYHLPVTFNVNEFAFNHVQTVLKAINGGLFTKIYKTLKRTLFSW